MTRKCGCRTTSWPGTLGELTESLPLRGAEEPVGIIASAASGRRCCPTFPTKSLITSVPGATSRWHEGCGPWRGGLPLWRSWRRTQERWGAASFAQLCGSPSCGSRSSLSVVCSGRPPVALKVECYGATRPQDGGSANEDAFVIGHGPIKFAALCDGAGHAEQVARRALKLFQTFFKEAPPESVLADATWAKWVRLLDSALLGRPPSTFGR